MPFDGAEFFLSASRRVADASWRRPLPESRRPEPTLFAAPRPEDAGAAAVLLLETAKRMIEDERYWTQGTYRTLHGRLCAIEALHEAARCLKAPSALPFAYELLLSVTEKHGFCRVEQMNDRSQHREVLAAFDEAIAAAREDTPAAAWKRQPR